nr:nonfunctional DNA polymerase iota [Mus musculus]
MEPSHAGAAGSSRAVCSQGPPTQISS